MSLLVITKERSYSLSSMLPYDIATKKNGQIITGLYEYSLLITGAEQAIEALEKGNFEQFDALVGENMCQIRAIKIAIIASSTLETVSMLKTSLVCIKEKIDAISESIAKQPKGSLKDLLEKEHLEVILTKDEAFLTQSYLLTVTKDSKPPKANTPLLANDLTNPKKLQQLCCKVSGTFTNSLVKKLKKELSSASVEFIRKCAQTLPDKEELVTLVSDEFVVEHNDCLSLPFFFVNDILMRQASASSIPIVVNLERKIKDQDNTGTKQISLLFKKTSSGYKRTILPSTYDLSSPSLVLHGIMERLWQCTELYRGHTEAFML
jgi:hypothetical protein